MKHNSENITRIIYIQFQPIGPFHLNLTHWTFNTASLKWTCTIWSRNELPPLGLNLPASRVNMRIGDQYQWEEALRDSLGSLSHRHVWVSSPCTFSSRRFAFRLTFMNAWSSASINPMFLADSHKSQFASNGWTRCNMLCHLPSRKNKEKSETGSPVRVTCEAPHSQHEPESGR